jgi:hypothetical protein
MSIMTESEVIGVMRKKCRCKNLVDHNGWKISQLDCLNLFSFFIDVFGFTVPKNSNFHSSFSLSFG